MPLSAGTRLGHDDVTALIHDRGMGLGPAIEETSKKLG